MKSCAGHKGTEGGVLTPHPGKGPATQWPSLGKAKDDGRVGEEKNLSVPELKIRIVQATAL